MNTKEKIIYKSIELFNKYGINNISTKKIADECGINQGNLYYYFKRKKDILIEIFEILVNEFAYIYTLKTVNDYEENYINIMLNQVISSQKKYNFFYRDMFVIFSEYPDFKNIYKEKFKIRMIEIEKIFFKYVEMGVFKPIIKQKLHILIPAIWFNISFWSLTLDTKGLEVNDLEIEKFKKFIYNLLSPYLTEKGEEKFNTLFTNTP